MSYKDKADRTCGFIDVEEKEKSGKFSRRYVRLDTSKGVLEWFADNPLNLPNNTSAHGTIDINFITQVDIPIKVKFKAKHCFVVNTPMRRYYFQADDDNDMKLWVEILNNASKIVVSDEEPDEAYQSLDGGNSLTSVQSQEEFSYKTEIVAGVVIQKKVFCSEDNHSIPVKNIDSRSHSLVPTNDRDNFNVKSVLSSPRTLMEGWAVKQGHVRKNWKRRYFILTTSGFSYYKTDHDKDPIRIIPLREILAAKLENSALSMHKDNLFFVVTTERIYYIQADSPQDMEVWVKSFNDAVHSARSFKHRTKGSEPGDYIVDEERDRIPSGSSGNVARRRKLDVTLSVASPLQRNSAQFFLPKSKSGHGNSASQSPVAYYRLSTADEGFHHHTLTPNKSHRSKKQNIRRVASSSEESGGLCSSVDSLTTPFAEVQVTPTPKEQSSPVKNKKSYKRSCSGSDMPSPLIQYVWLPSDQIDTKERHSFPSSKTLTNQQPKETLIPSSASFSSPKKQDIDAKPPLSSMSFSSPNPSIRSSRSFQFDPKVDLRAAVKPSTVKKKRNTGILFSLNNVLNKKAEKMNKSAEKKKR